MNRPKGKRPYKPSNRKALHTWVDRELFLQVKAITDYAGLTLSTVVHDALTLWLMKEREGGKRAVAATHSLPGASSKVA